MVFGEWVFRQGAGVVFGEGEGEGGQEMTKPKRVTEIRGLDAMRGTPWEVRWERKHGQMGDVSWKDMPGGGRMIKMMNWFLYRRGLPFAEEERLEGRMVRQMEERVKRGGVTSDKCEVRSEKAFLNGETNNRK